MNKSTVDTVKIIESIDNIIKQENSKSKILQRICELLKEEVYHYDWVGFYELESEEILILGPYVGKPTDHTHIPVGKGVCGQVAASGKAMTVQDVSQMDNYIACSLDVQSEIVVPVLKEGKFVAEIDIDSHAAAPFTEKDTALLTQIAEKINYLF